MYFTASRSYGFCRRVHHGNKFFTVRWERNVHIRFPRKRLPQSPAVHLLVLINWRAVAKLALSQSKKASTDLSFTRPCKVLNFPKNVHPATKFVSKNRLQNGLIDSHPSEYRWGSKFFHASIPILVSSTTASCLVFNECLSDTHGREVMSTVF